MAVRLCPTRRSPGVRRRRRARGGALRPAMSQVGDPRRRNPVGGPAGCGVDAPGAGGARSSAREGAPTGGHRLAGGGPFVLCAPLAPGWHVVRACPTHIATRPPSHDTAASRPHHTPFRILRQGGRERTRRRPPRTQNARESRGAHHDPYRHHPQRHNHHEPTATDWSSVSLSVVPWPSLFIAYAGRPSYKLAVDDAGFDYYGHTEGGQQVGFVTLGVENHASGGPPGGSRHVRCPSASGRRHRADQQRSLRGAVRRPGWASGPSRPRRAAASTAVCARRPAWPRSTRSRASSIRPPASTMPWPPACPWLNASGLGPTTPTPTTP